MSKLKKMHENRINKQLNTIIPKINIFLFKDLFDTSSGSLLIQSSIDKTNIKISKYYDPYNIPYNKISKYKFS